MLESTTYSDVETTIAAAEEMVGFDCTTVYGDDEEEESEAADAP